MAVNYPLKAASVDNFISFLEFHLLAQSVTIFYTKVENEALSFSMDSVWLLSDITWKILIGQVRGQLNGESAAGI